MKQLPYFYTNFNILTFHLIFTVIF
uniref:Uncharacterized protein n=1 Tax=Ralstonia syzygii R24 TaxID=907261 RepID=G3AAB7_9RALS|nr:hypothetical protein RALSY_mp10816 [Ralstonia syzygii R24]